LLLFVAFTLRAGDSALVRRLKEIPGVVKVAISPGDSMFAEQVEVEFRQPLDHGDPGRGSFLQHVFVSHLDTTRPVLFETEGYAVRGARPRELTRIFRCNQIIVEHRYFGASRPDSMIWKYLTLKQSADDLHAIARALRAIYPGKWISSGTSKGGQTTLLYRYFYPHDVDVSVAYVAPVNLAREDPRLIAFFRSVGTPECRARIRDYQLALLGVADSMLPIMDAYARSKKTSFPLGTRRTFEHMVLEYPFSLWQYGTPCESTPSATAPPESLFAHLLRVVGYSLFTAEGTSYFAPFQYQAYTELGYYGYDVTELKERMRAAPPPDNRDLAPPDAEIRYDCSVMQQISLWLQNEGSNILFLYGGTDPWSATAIELVGKTNAVKIVKPGGSHTTRIGNLPPDQRELALSTLERWLGILRSSEPHIR